MDVLLVLQTIQCITAGALFIEILIVFSRWRNAIHSYLFLACVSSLVSNLGYLFELSARSEETYLTALKLSYMGRAWIVFSFFLFAAKMCRITIPGIVKGFLVFVHTGICISVLTIGYNSLYYTDYRFVIDEGFPLFIHSNGYVHDLFMMMNVVLCILALGWLIRAYRSEKDRKAGQRFFMLIVAFGVQILFFLLQLTGITGISRFYDLTMPGSLLGTMFMLIGILRFNLLGTREIARDFAIDRISEAIIATDKAGRIRYYNETAAKVYPQLQAFYSAGSDRAADNTGQGDGALRRINTPYDIISSISDAVSKGETLAVDGRIYSPEKNDLMYQGENYGSLYTLVDDTDQYHYMEELKKQKEIADSANESKSRFLAGMSHEIRTPINAVLGMDEMILRESDDKNIRGYATDIMSAGRTLLALINDILDLSKVEEGRMEIIPVQYDLSSLIGDVVNMIRGRAEKKGLDFILKADEHTPRILVGDEIRIRQCIMNLMTNAVKYTEDGEVTFEISYKEKDHEHILLCFTVSDTGIGMKEEDMKDLFSPYKRIEEKRNRAVEGTGLGMSITGQLLGLMGSELEVKSEYGRGSVFSFTIEQGVVRWEELGELSDRYDSGSASQHEYHEMFHAPDARILVVDDTEMNITVIESLLKRTQIGIDSAMSGEEAINLSSKYRYDMIFIDHMMPDMDGIETLRYIRQSGMNTETPAVALTANAVSGAREMYLNAGFTDYLSKPVDGVLLEKMLLQRLPADRIITENAPEQACDETPSDQPSELLSDQPSKLLSELPGIIADMKQIDGKAGLANCGSMEGYRSVLSVFCRTAASKADEIEMLYKNGDIRNYTIKVHALKSSARIIGAGELSGLALKLEEAGKRADMEYISSNTDRLLDMYREFDLELTGADNTDEELPELSGEALREAYQTMIEIAGSMDFGLMDNMLKETHRFRMAEEDVKRIDRVEEMLTELDWDGIIKAAEEALR